MNTKELERRTLMLPADFEGQVWELPSKPERWYKFIDNGKDVLAIAHLDHVCPNQSFGTMNHNGVQKAFGAMDDRAGCYLILDYLPKLLGGMPYDVLLTIGEEHSQSTAEIFKPPRKYKWMFQFDREGLDCATYDYGTDELDTEIKKYGWNPVRGSSTDICYLYKQGCRGFNFGMGGHLSHTEWNHVVMSELDTSARWFVKWWADHKDEAFPFNEKTDRRKQATYVYSGGKWEWGRWEGYYQDDPNYYRIHVWDQKTGKYVLREENGKKGKKDKNSRHPTTYAAADYVFDRCEDCDEVVELDPESYLCRSCVERYAAKGVYQTRYQWRDPLVTPPT